MKGDKEGETSADMIHCCETSCLHMGDRGLKLVTCTCSVHSQAGMLVPAPHKLIFRMTY